MALPTTPRHANAIRIVAYEGKADIGSKNWTVVRHVMAVVLMIQEMQERQHTSQRTSSRLARVATNRHVGRWFFEVARPVYAGLRVDLQ